MVCAMLILSCLSVVGLSGGVAFLMCVYVCLSVCLSVCATTRIEVEIDGLMG